MTVIPTPAAQFSHGTTAYIGPNAPIESQEFRNRLMLGYLLIDRFSDAWTHRFANLYLSMPENVNIVNWPGVPWAHNAEATLDVTKEEWVYITTPKNNPERKSVWTGLYFDPTANEWMVSCETPIDIAGRHLMSIGHDILLNALFDRVFNDHLEGAHNFIFREDGRLIAHPNKIAELEAHKGLLTIESLDDENLKNTYRALAKTIRVEGRSTFIHEYGDNLLAVSRISGPGWWFVTVYPKSLLASSALMAAKFILLLGALSLLLELAMLYLVMRSKVVAPIERFREASEAIENGYYHKVAGGSIALPDTVANEIGRLARVFRSMAGSVEQYRFHMEELTGSLEQQVKSRTAELEKAKEIAEYLARTDSLTNIANRHRFSEESARIMAQAKRESSPVTLCLLDLDHFKSVNDRHGHPVGDQVLVACAEAFRRTVRESDLLGRVGGEEFALLLPNTDVEHAQVLAERVRDAIERLVIPLNDGQQLKLTVSIGMASQSEIDYNFEHLYSEADVALYRAKTEGRNRVVMND